MLALIEITPWHWIGFGLLVLGCIALDLGVLQRGPRIIGFHESLRRSMFWCILAMVFAIALVPLRGRAEAVDFITGYIIELSMSMDNVFVIALIFAYFRVATQYQHRVLFWGIIGALVMRGVMIGGGIALVDRFAWMFYLLGAFVVFAGVKMLFDKSDSVQPEKNPVVRLARKCFPVAEGDHGQKFLVQINGRKLLTSLALVLLMVETTDLIFALDSIPAIFAVTTKPFIVFTSNVFAVLGLRSLYFVLAGAIDYFRYLKAGLAGVLILVGAKMLVAPHGGAHHWFQVEIPGWISLVIIAVVLAGAVLASLLSKKSGPK
ncbi:MAG TPA: TerC family protein [Candidatus Sulfotelmatobacter sp.]|jgi:tellurite resistance protein TerC|nr:TerC family protein [Candidatus Sulfotelmatobacter sp.]